MHDVQAYFGVETPLRGRSGGHTGTAPTIQTRASKLRARNQKVFCSQERCKRSKKWNNTLVQAIFILIT